jgi:hypothetical protein
MPNVEAAEPEIANSSGFGPTDRRSRFDDFASKPDRFRFVPALIHRRPKIAWLSHKHLLKTVKEV